MTDTLTDAVTTLQRARDEQAQVVAHETVRLQFLDEALNKLQQQVLIIDPALLPKRHDYAGMGIVEAAKRWLAEVGEAHSTREIADAIRERGVTTKSKNFIPTVYATLSNAKAFKRVGDAWLLEDEGSRER